tara:strand:- start:364 stop:1071 length:708 start_codon:yes stop_codon:yes gene_type:complete
MKKIIFKALEKKYDTLEKLPVPANKKLPKWYKDINIYGDRESTKELIVNENLTNSTFKKCIPILDALTLGYIIETQFDVVIKHYEDTWDLSWKTQETIFEPHAEHTKNIETPYGYYPRVAKYSYRRMPITPKGYSSLIISPVGYNNLPFKALAGVVDTDRNISGFALPVWVSKNHRGVVKHGTPLAQVIPFKRDNWEMIGEYFDDDDYYIQEQNSFGRFAINHYANKIWQKKKFK